MRSWRGGWLLVGWALMFGNGDKGWREVDRFDSRSDCEDAIPERAREVREKSIRQPPLADVLRLYRCEQAKSDSAAH